MANRDKRFQHFVRAEFACLAWRRTMESPALLGRIRQHFPRFPRCYGTMCVMHIHPKGLGGLDERNILPSCQAHNDWQTTHVSMEHYGELLETDLQHEADTLWERFIAGHYDGL